VAAKVLDAVRPPFRVDGHEVSIAASVGVSVYPDDGTSPDDLVRNADGAMYRDKRRQTTPDPGAAGEDGEDEEEREGEHRGAAKGLHAQELSAKCPFRSGLATRRQCSRPD
jgi:GGDEF domain-containing protein